GGGPGGGQRRRARARRAGLARSRAGLGSTERAMTADMPQRMPPRQALPWSVPLARSEVPETGRHLDIVADGETRAAIAKLAGLIGLPRLEATFDVTPRGRAGPPVAGQVSATVGAACRVTLEAT